MRDRLRAIALTVFAAATLAVASHAFQPGILIDDFNDGDAVGWDQNDFTGLGIFDASSGAYVIRSSGPIAVDDPSVGSIESHWVRSFTPRYSNGTLRGTVKANTVGTTAGFLVRDSEATESDYGFYGSTSFGTFYIERFEFAAHPNAPQTIIAMADPATQPFEVGKTYYIEARFVGHSISMKFWEAGTAEPASPQLQLIDKLLKPSRVSRLSVLVFFDPEPLMEAGVTAVTVNGTFDDITFSAGASSK